MHIGHMDAQALAANLAQEAVDARARLKTELTKRERLALAGKLAAQNSENPEYAVEGMGEEDEAETSRGDQPSSGGSLNAKA
jgi:hypothetical protein